MTARRQNWFEGWRLFCGARPDAGGALHLDRLDAAVRGRRRADGDPLHRADLAVVFCLAFSAAALARLWPNGWTRWQRRNRRYLGVTFAASHGLHAIAIGCYAVMDPPGYAAATSAAS